MQLAHPIGLALSKRLLDRLDAIARSRGASRSNVARTLLAKGVSDYERDAAVWSEGESDSAATLRTWRPRASAEANADTLSSFGQEPQP
jgi:hypothetical protein